jgi:hypothetical protein
MFGRLDSPPQGVDDADLTRRYGHLTAHRLDPRIELPTGLLIRIRDTIEFHLTWFTMGVYDMATTIPYPYST